MKAERKATPNDLTGPEAGLAIQRQKASEFRDRLVNRYASVGRLGFWGRLRLALKRSIWLAVIGGARALKRLIDITGSIFLLIVLSPIFVLLALLIRLDSPGPVLFKQTRIGKWAIPF